MEKEILEKIDQQNIKIDKMYKTVEQMRRYFFWTLILSLVFFVLPLIALIFVMPRFLENYVGVLGGF